MTREVHTQKLQAKTLQVATNPCETAKVNTVDDKQLRKKGQWKQQEHE